MKALSFRQPWAWLAVNGIKPIDNRPRCIPKSYVLPLRIYVHAGLGGLSIPGRSFSEQWILDRLTDEEKELYNITPKPRGFIIGEVDLGGCVHESDSPWFEGPHGFVLENPVAYAEPIPYKGQLGFFEVELVEEA